MSRRSCILESKTGLCRSVSPFPGTSRERSNETKMINGCIVYLRLGFPLFFVFRDFGDVIQGGREVSCDSKS